MRYPTIENVNHINDHIQLNINVKLENLAKVFIMSDDVNNATCHYLNKTLLNLNTKVIELEKEKLESEIIK